MNHNAKTKNPGTLGGVKKMDTDRKERLQRQMDELLSKREKFIERKNHWEANKKNFARLAEKRVNKLGEQIATIRKSLEDMG